MNYTKSTTPVILCIIALFMSNLFSAPHLSISTATSAGDTMVAGQSLTASQTLVSKEGRFELGFFTPGNSQNYYIGIWYNQVALVQKKKTIIWVANRNKPISITDLSSSEFKLLGNGHLVLLVRARRNASYSKIPIWTSSTDSTTSKSMNDSLFKALLGDNANLVITSSGNGNIIWQSFDHLTNAYLPGAKNGYYNKLTKKSRKISSWRNSEDPSDGIYSAQLDPDNSFSFLWNQSQKYYNSGVWKGRYFDNNPEMELENTHILHNFTSNKKESYFSYFLTNESVPLVNFMDLSGQMTTIIWMPETKDWTVIWSKPMLRCQVTNSAIQKTGACLITPVGCVRNSSQCGNKDSFSKIPNILLSGISPSANALAFDNAEKCELACLQNCSCCAYAFATNGSRNDDGIRCLLWYGNLLNIEQHVGDEGNDLYIRLPPSQDHLGSRMKASVIWTIVGAVVFGTTILVGMIILFLRKWQIRRTTGTLEPEKEYAFLTAFRFKELKIATKNFSSKLGSGSFGSVFKGTLSDSTVIAVKRLEGVSQDQKQFRNEVSTIGLIHHVNLVRLRGFCSEVRKVMLVYDLMPNGSLDKHLFHQNNSRILNWQQRYQIAIGIARGLAYLHEECRDCIIHCDIKPENILIDADFSPQVADFGLAKLLGHEFSRVLTSMRGTIGYFAPEWTSGVAITAKADVYSYGMMLFEIISGRRNLKQSNDGKVWFYPTWAANKVITKGQPVLSILDINLKGYADIEEVNRAFRVACWCIQEEETQRPSMGQVVQILEGHLEVNPPPIQMHLQAMIETEETLNFFSE